MTQETTNQGLPNRWLLAGGVMLVSSLLPLVVRAHRMERRPVRARARG